MIASKTATDLKKELPDIKIWHDIKKPMNSQENGKSKTIILIKILTAIVIAMLYSILFYSILRI